LSQCFIRAGRKHCYFNEHSCRSQSPAIPPLQLFPHQSFSNERAPSINLETGPQKDIVFFLIACRSLARPLYVENRISLVILKEFVDKTFCLLSPCQKSQVKCKSNQKSEKKVCERQ